MTDAELVISDDARNIRMLRQDAADMILVDDPLNIYDIEGIEFDATEIGYMSMVWVDNGPRFIRYKYGAQRVAYMFLETLDRKYTVESETMSFNEMINSGKSFFVDEFMLVRKGLRFKSAVDPAMLRHVITAVYRHSDDRIMRVVREMLEKHIS